MTADSWLGHQNVSFKARAFPSPWGGSRFMKTRGGLIFLIIGQDAAAIDSLFDPVSAWLQSLPTSW